MESCITPNRDVVGGENAVLEATQSSCLIEMMDGSDMHSIKVHADKKFPIIISEGKEYLQQQ